MPGFSSGGIFLSYRREDAAPYARLLQFQLSERFPDAHVFMDLDSIEAGLDFAEVIREAIDSCAVLVTLIGRQWATLVDEDGHRRLDDPDDYVRFEVQTALERGVRVVPVLVDGARPLQKQQLPSGLHKLARLHALELSYGRYQYDADRLLELIQRVLDAAAGTGAAHKSSSTGNATAPTVRRTHNVPPDGNALGAAAPKGSEPVRSDGARATRVLTDAEHVAWSIADQGDKAMALAAVAKVLAATDPFRAVRLIADAERLAQLITDEGGKGSALAAVAEALAATDPDRAERITRSITDKDQKASALTDVAEVLAATDADRAERIAQSIRDKSDRASALIQIAKAVTATRPDHAVRLIANAERIAQSINNKNYYKPGSLVEVAEAVAATYPGLAVRLIADAERLAQSITDESDKAFALADVVTGLTTTDPDRAERVAQSITNEFWKASALTAVAGVLAATDPDRAERIAQSITDERGGEKVDALLRIAKALAGTEPSYAARLIADAERVAQAIANEILKAYALVQVVRALATTDPDRAERIAQSITHEKAKVWALLWIAKV